MEKSMEVTDREKQKAELAASGTETLLGYGYSAASA